MSFPSSFQRLDAPQRVDAFPGRTDRFLIEQLKQGQQRAFQVVYQRYARLVYTLALRIVKSVEDAEDITQEIFLALCRQCQYDSRRGSLKTFLAVSARSRAIDRLRSRTVHHKALSHLSATTAHCTAANPLEHVVNEQTAEHVNYALCQLSRKERVVLEKAYYEDLSQSQIARHFCIPLGTVKSRSRQGLRKLRGMLEDAA
ncbi:MAG: sigma-70 family RNA polymerase sigma factor [Cyanobacteria bacterium P01_A01_bin.116]